MINIEFGKGFQSAVRLGTRFPCNKPVAVSNEIFAGAARIENQDGFTLLELLVAILLLTIGLFAVIGMQTVALKANTRANQLSVATSLAQQTLEDVLSWDASSSTFTAATTTEDQFSYHLNPNDALHTYTYIPGAGIFTPACRRTLGNGTNGVPEDTVRIVITISYGINNSNSVTFSGFKRI